MSRLRAVIVALAVLAIPVVSPTVTSAAGSGDDRRLVLRHRPDRGRRGHHDDRRRSRRRAPRRVLARWPSTSPRRSRRPLRSSPSGRRGRTRPWASNLNFSAGQTVANAVITKVGADGTISIFNNSGAVHVVVDVVGWFPDNQSYVGVTPARLADTRNSPTIDGRFSNTGPSRAGPDGRRHSSRPGGRAGFRRRGGRAERHRRGSDDALVPHGVAHGCEPANRVAISTSSPGQTVPNMVIAKVGAGGQVSIYNNTGSVDVVVDVLGWFPSGNTFNPLVPGAAAGHAVDLVARRWSDHRRPRSPDSPAAHRPEPGRSL